MLPVPVCLHLPPNFGNILLSFHWIGFMPLVYTSAPTFISRLYKFGLLIMSQESCISVHNFLHFKNCCFLSVLIYQSCLQPLKVLLLIGIVYCSGFPLGFKFILMGFSYSWFLLILLKKIFVFWTSDSYCLLLFLIGPIIFYAFSWKSLVFKKSFL